MILSFPHNPTSEVVDLPFMEKLIDFAKEHEIWLIHDLAYADLCYDDYKAPSILQVPGAKDIAVEFYSMSKGYGMAGWRLGFCLGNAYLIETLARVKAYLDYGVFLPVQLSGITALNRSEELIEPIIATYARRRDALVSGMQDAGWQIQAPKATMFVWAKIPERFGAADQKTE